jgi:hypothetical protein
MSARGERSGGRTCEFLDLQNEPGLSLWGPASHCNLDPRSETWEERTSCASSAAGIEKMPGKPVRLRPQVSIRCLGQPRSTAPLPVSGPLPQGWLSGTSQPFVDCVWPGALHPGLASGVSQAVATAMLTMGLACQFLALRAPTPHVRKRQGRSPQLCGGGRAQQRACRHHGASVDWAYAIQQVSS